MSSETKPSDFKSNFNRALVEGLAASLASVDAAFAVDTFVEAATEGLEDLELKDRARHIAAALAKVLPDDFPTAAKLLVEALGDEGDPDVTDWLAFSVWPLTIYVEEHGLEHFDDATHALGEMTKRFSSEFAVRPFLERYPDKMLEQMRAWAGADNVHLRRLASEGCRPRLPWGSRLRGFVEDPSPVLEILELLKDDPELYVRRSVANNLNDISKDHPDLAAEVGARWMVGATKERQWVVKHALRTLVKAGHNGAMSALGFTVEPQIEVVGFEHSPSVTLGGALEFSFELRATGTQPQSLVIDFLIHHMKKNGKTSPKTFKLATKTLEPGAPYSVTKSHSIRPISTRKYYAGTHRLEITVAGVVVAGGDFELVAS